MNTVESVYLAARFSKQVQMREFRDLFKNSNIHVTSTWLDQDPGDDSLETAPYDVSAKHAIKDLVDVRTADGLVFFAEKELARRGGRHVEFGYALALGKPIYVVGGNENIFHFVPGIRHFQTVQDVIQNISLTNLYLSEMKGR